MQKKLLLILGVVCLVLATMIYLFVQSDKKVERVAYESVGDAEAVDDAEWVSFSFMRDVLVIVPPDPPEAEVIPRVYDKLSRQAKSNTSLDTLPEDMLAFTDLQGIPRSIQVVEMRVVSEDTLTAVVNLFYDEYFAVMLVELVREEGGWKVDAVRPPASVEELPVPPPPTLPPTVQDEPVLPPGVVEEPPAKVSTGQCYVGGCSSQVCSENPDVITTCEYREEYACYRETTCERQLDGQCGWVETPAFKACIAGV